MTEIEIRMQCLHLAFEERKANMANGVFATQDWLVRAEELWVWATEKWWAPKNTEDQPK